MNKLLVSVLILAGCAGKPEVTDTFDDLAGLDTKTDAFSSKMKIVGTLAAGQSSSAIHYTKTPRYRAVQLALKGPGTLALTVRSTDGGDAVTWLLDGTYKTLAKNDDADASTLDSHIDYALPAGGGTYYIVFRDYDYAAHDFVVDVAPLEPAASCAVGYDHPDEPPVAVVEVESLLGSHLGSYQLYDGSEPACLAWRDAAVRAAVAEDVRASCGIDWQDATPAVVQGAVKSGGKDFAAALGMVRAELESYASSSTSTGDTVFQTAWPRYDADVRAILGDSLTHPSAYVEFDLHVEAAECSQEGHVRIDTRTGEVLILRVHGC